MTDRRTFAILQTIIIEIEILQNNRPLTHVSPDLRDSEPIHLLYGKRITTLPHCAIELEELDVPDCGGASNLSN